MLIFHQAALGDFVVTWPVAIAMGRLFPQSRILYVAPSSKGRLAERAIGVESVDIETGWHSLHSEDCKLPAANEKLVAGAHTVISFVSDALSGWERNIRQINPDCIVVSLSTKPASEPQPLQDEGVPPALRGHVCEIILRQLKPWPTLYASVLQILRSIHDRGVGYRRSPDGSVVIHPGAGKAEKCWPVDRFAELANRLREAGRRVRVLLGEAELETWSAGAIDSISRAAEVRKPGTFVDLLNELGTAGTFVGNDSGPSHLAGIVGVPTVALFGAPSTRWRPLGPNVTVIERASLAQIPVEDIVRAMAHFSQ